MFPQKMVLGTFKIAHHLIDGHVFMWQSLKIIERFWNFDNFNFETNVLKNENLFQKTAVPFLVESTKIESAKIESATPFQKSM